MMSGGPHAHSQCGEPYCRQSIAGLHPSKNEKISAVDKLRRRGMFVVALPRLTFFADGLCKTGDQQHWEKEFPTHTLLAPKKCAGNLG